MEMMLIFALRIAYRDVRNANFARKRDAKRDDFRTFSARFSREKTVRILKGFSPLFRTFAYPYREARNAKTTFAAPVRCVMPDAARAPDNSWTHGAAMLFLRRHTRRPGRCLPFGSGCVAAPPPFRTLVRFQTKVPNHEKTKPKKDPKM